MPYTNPKHKTRQQRQQRRAGQVRRVEIVLSANNERDHEIHDFLESLPHGAVGEFIRAAIIEKIQREQHQPEVPSASDQFNAILAELSALRKAVSQPVPVVAKTQPPAQRSAPPDPAPELTLSSGLDMSAPRPRKTPTRTPAPPPILPEEKPFDEEAARRLLVESINAFGKNLTGR